MGFSKKPALIFVSKDNILKNTIKTKVFYFYLDLLEFLHILSLIEKETPITKVAEARLRIIFPAGKI